MFPHPLPLPAVLSGWLSVVGSSVRGVDGGHGQQPSNPGPEPGPDPDPVSALLAADAVDAVVLG